MLSEIFPLNMRGFGYGVSALFAWLANFAVSLSFPVLVDEVGMGFTFLLFAAINAAALVFVLRWVPETRGKTLEQIEEHFRLRKEIV